MNAISLTRGYLSLTGPIVDSTAGVNKTSIAPPHITLFTKAELTHLKKTGKFEQLMLIISSGEVATDFVDLGVGGENGVYFKVIVYPAGSKLREKMGCCPKQFHITLSGKDDHQMDKGFASLNPTSRKTLTSKEIEMVCEDIHVMGGKDIPFLQYLYDMYPTEKLFHKISADCNAINDDGDISFIINAIDEHPLWSAPYIRFGDAMSKMQNWKGAMLAYTIGWSKATNIKVKEFLQNKLITTSAYTEWGPVLTETEKDALDRIKDVELQKRVKNMMEVCKREGALFTVPVDYMPQLTLESRERLYTYFCKTNEYIKLPRFFRWILPYKLAAMSTPRNANDITILKEPPFLITCIVTLTEETPLEKEWFFENIKNIFISVPNYKAPTFVQVDQFVSIVHKEARTLVHCGGGKGRAGTFIACYIAICGFGETIAEQPIHSAKSAIEIVRKMRPGSIETKEQEKFIEDYVSRHWKRGYEAAVVVQEPETELQMTGTFPVNPSIVVLCGAQGSGKSFFAKLLHDKQNYEIISQDELGSKAACFSALSAALKKKRKIVVDKCNPDINSRKELLGAVFNPKDAICVHFDYKKDICVKRIDARTEHPTIKPGRGETPVSSMLKMMQPPKLSEGFACVFTVTSIASANQLTQKYFKINPIEPTPPPLGEYREKLCKFPRTRHLCNLGSASRDDLLFSVEETAQFLKCSPQEKIVVQEKIDGANMGISLDKVTSSFKIQNRSHYVNAKSHIQFKPLDKWISDHREDLWRILTENDTRSPGELILYGEWLVARHSIHYHDLPDIFMAFDLYDISQDKFYSTIRLKKLIDGTDISIIRDIHDNYVGDRNGLIKLVENGKSEYYDGPLEGVYIRKEDEEWLLDRGKIVRPDFICGNENWSKGIITFNKVGKNKVI